MVCKLEDIGHDKKITVAHHLVNGASSERFQGPHVFIKNQKYENPIGVGTEYLGCQRTETALPIHRLETLLFTLRWTFKVTQM